MSSSIESRHDVDCTFRDEDELDAVLVDLKLEPEEKYPAKAHARAVARHLGVEEGLIYLPGLSSVTYRDSDQEVPFRQGRYFYYLTGLDYRSCIVTYSIQHDNLFVWLPSPSRGRSVIFNGPSVTKEQARAVADFDNVAYVSGIQSYLEYFAHHEPGQIYLLHSYHQPQISPDDKYGNGSRTNLINPAPFNITDLMSAMNAARAIKSPHEIKRIRKASAITAQAHLNVLREIRKLKNEAEIEAIFAATCISNQAKKQAYEIIAGSGTNASTLHYGANNEPLEGRQLVCLDAGCEWKCYASDVTRTFPISGRWTPEAKAIYNIVARMQDECIEIVRPGADYRAIHMHAHKIAIEGLMELRLLRNGTFEELYRSGVSVAFFPHGLGHHMGLEVHDVGPGGYLLYGFEGKAIDWKEIYSNMLTNTNTTNSSVLRPNMVITVEPGIYFSKYALQDVYLKNPEFARYINADLLHRYYPVGGVRIEDDLLVTEGGYENLTTVPKGDEALKIINEGRGW